MSNCPKWFAITCSLLAVATCAPNRNNSDISDEAAQRMLVWPPRITRKNVSSDLESLRLTPETPEGPKATILITSSNDEAQDRSDLPVIDEGQTLNISKENLNNESQAINQSSNHHNSENAHVDIDSIQLTTSEPQIVPSVEAVAIFRNAGTIQNGNTSYSVEVEEIATNITEGALNNTSQPASEESELDLEHNTEIYGRTAAEELADLSVIDVLLRKRRKASTVKRYQPEFDKSVEVSHSHEESEEISPDIYTINIPNVTILNTFYNETTEDIKSNTSQTATHPKVKKDTELQTNSSSNLELQGNKSTNSHPAVNDSLPTNEGQASDRTNSPSKGDIRRTDSPSISGTTPNNNSTPIHAGHKPDNISLVTPYSSPTIILTKNSAVLSNSDHKITNEELNATTEQKTNTFNIPQTSVLGRNLQDTKTNKSSNDEANVNIHNLTSNNPLHSTNQVNNYTESNSKHQNSTSNETLVTEGVISEEIFTTDSTEKAVKFEKVTTTEKDTIFEGFKSIAEYIGFSA